MLLARRLLIVVVSLGIMVVTTIYLLSKPNLYTSSAVILPSGESGQVSVLENLVGLGGQMTRYDENSSVMFPVVLRSNMVVDSVARSVYSFRHEGKSYRKSLADYFDITNPDRLRHAVRGITSITADQRTGEIYLGVETRYPELSQKVVAGYLSRLEDFNRTKRRSQARENEEYLGRQLQIAKDELQSAEDNLETFQKSNLDWAVSGSPEILKELGRLQREVEVKSATYAMLAREHEMAKLEVQKDIPIVRLLDPPSMPTIKSGPFRRNLIIMSGIVAFVLTVFAVIIWHFTVQLTHGPERDEYNNLRQDITEAFPRTNRILNRLTTSIRDRLPMMNR
jgi:uncharacterized protein involved in exopolysaccharide biosynthesis